MSDDKNPGRSHPICNLSSPWRAAILATTLLGCALVADPAAAGEAFANRGADLVVIDLENGAITDIGAHDLNAFVLAYSPARVLYTVAKRPGIFENPQETWILDQRTGERTRVGEPPLGTGVVLTGDLTFDAAGNLWLAADGQLHSVDLVTGRATRIGTEPRYLQGLAQLDGQFYGIESDNVVYGGPPWRLVRLDATTGVSTLIAPLPALDDIFFLTMDFDPDGRLWILGYQLPPPGLGTSWLFRMDDPESGEVETLYPLDTSYPIEGMVLIPPRPAVEIPALGGPGMILLMTLLAATAWWRLR